jgi:hypothetical protein
VTETAANRSEWTGAAGAFWDDRKRKGLVVHYRNGREAKNGDKIAQLGYDGQITAVGVLYDATPGNDYCNGIIAPIQPINCTACICDCLHLDDVAELFKEKGLEERPEGK